jgi:hypothetical protein
VKSKIAVVALSAACLGYLAISSVRALQISETNAPLAVLFAISIILVVAISALLIIREIMFGIHISQMATVLEAEELLLIDDLPHTPSGQTEKEAADNRFNEVAKEAQLQPNSWRNWFRVALAYDESRDRKRAREAMRKAEKLFRAES